jgi:FlaA1/EpsC-like NDP-sugar epimerase
VNPISSSTAVQQSCVRAEPVLDDRFPAGFGASWQRKSGLLKWASAIFSTRALPSIPRPTRVEPVGFPRYPRTIVVGSGERAERLVRASRQGEVYPIDVVGLVGLDADRLNQTTVSTRLLGTIENLPRLAERYRAELAVIALDAGDLPQMRRVVELCIDANLELKTVPDGNEPLELGGNQLRNVRVEDLLGRPAMNLHLSPVKSDLHGRVVMLTGAAGSIGSELARQIASFQPARLILLDQSESDLYFTHLELRAAYPAVELVPVICDITHAGRLAQVYDQYRPSYVVHAAGYKHVPLMETNVLEAVRNNVLGTLLVATTAVRFGATKVLLISTDKAIKPSSVMGATKRVAERIIFGLPNLHRSGTDFRAVRFGNVLGSNGSVLPLFERQLAAGGPITVTHPLAERYFTTIPEAAQLVLQAGSLPETAGAIAMIDMGEPVRILELAEKLIRFSGRVPGKDIRIVFTGLRPGEKLSEEQAAALEATVPTSTERIRISQTTETAGPELVQKLSRLLACLDVGDRQGVMETLCELVPECVPPLSESRATKALAPLTRPIGRDIWEGVLAGGRWGQRERRRAVQRQAPEPDPRPVDRREGVVCRRQTARLGGRRRTDTGMLLPTGSSANPGMEPLADA